MPVTGGSQFDIFLARLLRLLLEGVQYINRIGEFRHIDDASFAQDVDANFINTCTHVQHRFPVGWHQASLYAEELEAYDLLHLAWEGSQIVFTGADELERLHLDNI